MVTGAEDNKIKSLIPGEVDMVFTTDIHQTLVFPFAITAAPITFVMTAFGDAPALPETVADAVESGGQKLDAEPKVTWEEASEADCSVLEGGTFTVSGSAKDALIP